MSTITSNEVNELTRLAFRLATKLRKMERTQTPGDGLHTVRAMFEDGYQMTNKLLGPPPEPNRDTIVLTLADFELAVERTLEAIHKERDLVDGNDSRRAVEYDATWLSKLKEELAR